MRNSRLKIVCGILMGMLMLVFVTAYAADDKADKPGRFIEAVNVTALPGGRVQIGLAISGDVLETEPRSFTIDNPARIALDFPGTLSRVDKKQMINIGVARSIHVIESRGRTRVIMNLDKMVTYQTRVSNNEVYVILESGVEEAMPVARSVFARVAEMVSTDNKTAVQSRHTIDNVDFRRGIDGQGLVIISMTDIAPPANVYVDDGNIILEFTSTRFFDESLQRRMDVIDFATPVTMINAYSKEGNVRLEIATSGDYEHLVYQTNERFTLEVKPVSDAKKERGTDEFGFKGERLTLNFQDIEVRAVLQLIADFTGLNMVTSDTVTGSVTLRLQNVPWDQAMDIILKTKGLAMRKVGNVMLVAPGEEIASREKQEFESQQQITDLAPLRTELIQVNYAKAADIAALLGADANSLLSERGNVAIDERTNSLLVQETRGALVDIRKLVAKLDIPVRQVLIEARVVIANDDFSRTLGMRFGVTALNVGANATTGISGTVAGADTLVNTLSPSTLISDRLNVNLPALVPAGQVALAVLGSDYMVDLELSAMQAEGEGEVISSPRVITSNANTALIEQGVEIPYQEASSSGATSVSFKKAVLKLEVTPQITPDDRVIMDLTINKDSVGEIFLGVPSINTREVSTQVLVNNGETVVLGGIYEQIRSDEVDKVPVLGDLPFIGALFRQTREVNDKAELLMFVTPKILKSGL